MTKLHTRGARLEYQKFTLGDFQIFNFKRWYGGNAEFREIEISERNSALNYSVVKKFYMRKLDLNIKKKNFGHF